MPDGRKRTLLLADDHPIFRTGLRQIVEEHGGFDVVAEVADGRAAVAQIGILAPDFAIFDLNMPGINGFDALQEITASGSGTRVLVVSMHAYAAYARKARDLGAIGFVAKEDAPTEVTRALEGGGSGFFMSQSVGSRHGTETAPFDDSEGEIDLSGITGGERKVLILLSLGKTSKEIARDLGISPRTVQAHRRNIAEKLKIGGPNRLLEIAIRNRSRLLRQR